MDEEADDHAVDDRDGGRLRGGEDAAVDAAEDDEGGEQTPRGVLERRADLPEGPPLLRPDVRVLPERIPAMNSFEMEAFATTP